MRSVFTLLLFCLLGFQAKAQWVDLPGYEYATGLCIRLDSARSMYQIDTSCSNSITSENLNISPKKELEVDKALHILEYYKYTDSITLEFTNYLRRDSIIHCDFKNFSQNLKHLTLHSTFYGLGTGKPNYLIIRNLPNSIVNLEIHTTKFDGYDIDRWPTDLTNLIVSEYIVGDVIGNFAINLEFPETLNFLQLEVPGKRISFNLPDNLKILVLYVFDFDYKRLENLRLLEEVVFWDVKDEINNATDFSLSNPSLKLLSLANVYTGVPTGKRQELNILKLPKDIKELHLYDYAINDFEISDSLKMFFLASVSVSPVFFQLLPDRIEKLFINNVTGVDVIDKFPKQLKYLNLRRMNIPSIPDFTEQLDSIYLSDITTLKCLPVFPKNLKLFEGRNLGAITCIPNETRYVKATEAWPVCTDNQFICNADEYTILSGTVYYDMNKNGVKDAGEVPVYGGVLSLNEETFATTNKDGIYKLILREPGTFEIKANSNHPNVSAILPAVKTIVYDENYVNDSVHFLIQIDDVKDLKITGTNLVARPGMQTSVTAFAENLGINDLSDVTVKIKKPKDWSLESATPAGYRTDNDTIIWENVNLAKLTNTSFKVQTQLPATATILGNPYQYEMWVSSASQTDATPSDNYYTISDIIMGSYDPNDKIVNYTSLTPENSNAQELVYTIRFQNTGTDTAFKVIVVDTIIGNLAPSSIRVLGASHDFTWEYTGQGIAAFTFDNILLPDSNVNEPASHGFVTLAVKANKDLAVGDSIYNRAGIYFDFNEPVITNKALTRIATVTSVYTQTNTSLKIYPNPAKDKVRVEWSSNERATLRLMDISGKVIQSQTLNQNYSDIDVSRLSKGMYLIQVQSAEGLSVGKLLIQ